MARHIEKLNIVSYRGITNLEINDLGDINILVGGNNSGKTSVLEAIQILSQPLDFDNIVMVGRQRDRYRITLYPSQSQYNSFLNIFAKNNSSQGKPLSISIGCNLHGQEYNINLSGEVKKALLVVEDLDYVKRITNRKELPVDEEVSTYVGTLKISNIQLLSQDPLSHDEHSEINVNINKYTRFVRSNDTAVFDCAFLSTIDHIVMEKFRPVIKNKAITTDVVNLLQKSFDKDIVDLRILEEEDGRTYQAIDHQQLGYVPLSTFGDGIKKVIAMASSVALIKDGVLLIDEYETAIHPSAMTMVFKFLIDTCKERNIQLFLTTHNIEAIEKLLECSDNPDNIRVITLQKGVERTIARVLDGKKALAAKNELGLELR